MEVDFKMLLDPDTGTFTAWMFYAEEVQDELEKAVRAHEREHGADHSRAVDIAACESNAFYRFEQISDLFNVKDSQDDPLFLPLVIALAVDVAYEAAHGEELMRQVRAERN